MMSIPVSGDRDRAAEASVMTNLHGSPWPLVVPYELPVGGVKNHSVDAGTVDEAWQRAVTLLV